MTCQFHFILMTLGLCTNWPAHGAGPIIAPHTGAVYVTEEESEPPLRLAMLPVIKSLEAPLANEPAVQSSLQQSAASRKMLDKYYVGQYQEVSREGLAVLKDEPHNAELRFVVANSLAWSGNINAALTQYAALVGSDFHTRAVLGLGNVNRWSGRPDRAAAAYHEVLQKEPGNENAIEGLRLASRELRTRTGARVGHAANSNDASRTSAALSHKWKTGNRAETLEITAGRFEEEKENTRVTQRDLSLRYEHFDAAIAPKMELTVQQSPRTRLFGTLTLKLADAPAYIEVGHINWGKLAFDPGALRDGLTANQLGGNVALDTELGKFDFAYNAYRVSDRNLVQHLNFRMTPSRQPFATSHIRGFAGVEARKARFFDARYWSPQEGHYNAFAGIGADWSNQRWQTHGSIQYGFPLTGDSGKSWSTGFGIKRWLGENWVANVDFWTINTPRDGGYRATSANASVEKLW